MGREYLQYQIYNGDEVVGLSKIKYNGTTVLRPNTFAPIGKIERGYTYQLGGTEMNFLSGQIVSMEDFSIDYDTKDILLRTGFENEIYNLILTQVVESIVMVNQL